MPFSQESLPKLGTSLRPPRATPTPDQPVMHGPWQIISSATQYVDPWVDVVRDEVIRPDGRPGSYCVVTLKPGVCVLALDDQDRVHLTREFHYAVGQTTIEAVSGGRDGEEPPLQAARRELEEELGWTAQDWVDLGRVDPFTASVYSPTQLYWARNLRPGKRQLDGTELIEPVVIPFPEVLQMVLKGQITHGPTCIAVLKVAILREIPAGNLSAQP